MRGPSRSGAARLLTRDLVLGILIVALAAGVCIMLGLWQFHRFEERRDRAAVIEAQQSADPQPLAAVLPTPDASLPAREDWAPVELHGSYCTAQDCVLYVRNRVLGGRTGFWQLVPFRTEDERTLLIVRGWVDMAAAESVPQDPPAVPAGPMTVRVQLRPAEGVLADRSNPDGQVQTVSPAEIGEAVSEQLPGLTLGAYGVLREEDPAGDLPMALERPDTSLGPHLSYAFQWWIFAAFFPIGLVVLTRRRLAEERELEAGGADEVSASDETAGSSAGLAQAPTASGHGARRSPRSRPSSRRRSRDEEEEDALIDQQQP